MAVRDDKPSPSAPRYEALLPLRGWILVLAAAAIVALLIALASHGYLGSYSRYIADDFCTAGFLRRDGFWGSQAHWYQTWSGRYAFTFLINVAHLAGPRLTPWLPGLSVICWASALIVFFRAWEALGMGRGRWLPITILPLLVLTLAFRGAPNIYQSLYWQTGMLTYCVPLIIGTLYLAWLRGGIGKTAGGARVGWASALLSAGVAFVAGGFSETFVSLQTGALAIGLLGAVAVLRGPRRAGAARLLAAGLAGSLVAMIVVVVAPGNDVRLSLMPDPPGVWALLRQTLYDLYIYIYAVAKHQTSALVLALAFPILLAFMFGHLPEAGTSGGAGRWRLSILAIPPLTAWMVLIPFAPSEYAISSYPDDRVMITQQYILFGGLVMWSWCVGRWAAASVRSRSTRPALWGALLFVPTLAMLSWLAAGSIQRVVEETPVYREYASFWDRRDRVLREAAAQPPGIHAVASLRHMGGLAEIGDDPAEWVNHCIALTYDVDGVVAK
jgi:hypothetical protein